jgi:hypothetical protein
MSRELVPLLIRARAILGVSQGELGEMLGSSRRSGQRWEAEGSTPMPKMIWDLARRVFKQDPQLADALARYANTNLVDLGLVEPPPSTAPAPEHLVDAVVCAAADAMHVLPEVVRPGLRAAFRRARLVHLDVATVERALGPGDETPPAR